MPKTISTASASSSAVSTGLLHDALEYTDLELAEIRERFGFDVAAIVFALTEDAEIEISKPASWSFASASTTPARTRGGCSPPTRSPT